MITSLTSLKIINEFLTSSSVLAQFTDDNFGGKIEYRIDHLPWILRTKGDVSFNFTSGQTFAARSSNFITNEIQNVNSLIEFGGFYTVQLNNGSGVCLVYSYNLPRLLPVSTEKFVESIKFIDGCIYPVFLDLFERSASV